jgi:hypothetical protein
LAKLPNDDLSGQIRGELFDDGRRP